MAVLTRWRRRGEKLLSRPFCTKKQTGNILRMGPESGRKRITALFYGKLDEFRFLPVLSRFSGFSRNFRLLQSPNLGLKDSPAFSDQVYAFLIRIGRLDKGENPFLDWERPKMGKITEKVEKRWSGTVQRRINAPYPTTGGKRRFSEVQCSLITDERDTNEHNKTGVTRKGTRLRPVPMREQYLVLILLNNWQFSLNFSFKLDLKSEKKARKWVTIRKNKDFWRKGS